MTLYEMLEKGQCTQKIRIEQYNDYKPHNDILFEEGTIREARADDVVWDYLMFPIEVYYVTSTGILVIVVEESNEV